MTGDGPAGPAGTVRPGLRRGSGPPIPAGHGAPPLRLETLSGDALRAALPALSRLCVEVFAEWPYLHAGDAAQERRTLGAYAEDPDAAIVAAFDGTALVGMASCQPLAGAYHPVRAAFRAHGLDPARFCYFGESVLLPAFRGRGAGVGFFTAREAHARRLGLAATAFCAVVRNVHDPRRPPGFTPLDAFWHRRGYVHQPALSCVFHWTELADDRETPHALSCWLKDPL